MHIDLAGDGIRNLSLVGQTAWLARIERVDCACARFKSERGPKREIAVLALISRSLAFRIVYVRILFVVSVGSQC